VIEVHFRWRVAPLLALAIRCELAGAEHHQIGVELPALQDHFRRQPAMGGRHCSGRLCGGSGDGSCARIKAEYKAIRLFILPWVARYR